MGWPSCKNDRQQMDIKSYLWQPRQFQRGRGRPSLRWSDKLVQRCGRLWTRKAKDRSYWKQVREGLLSRDLDLDIEHINIYIIYYFLMVAPPLTKD